MSYGTGFIFGLLNGGDFYNKGTEVEIRANPIKKTDFNWDIQLNFTKLKTDVKNLPAGVPEYYNSDTWLFGNARASAFVGDLGNYFMLYYYRNPINVIFFNEAIILASMNSFGIV